MTNCAFAITQNTLYLRILFSYFVNTRRLNAPNPILPSSPSRTTNLSEACFPKENHFLLLN